MAKASQHDLWNNKDQLEHALSSTYHDPSKTPIQNHLRPSMSSHTSMNDRAKTVFQRAHTNAEPPVGTSSWTNRSYGSHDSLHLANYENGAAPSQDANSDSLKASAMCHKSQMLPNYNKGVTSISSLGEEPLFNAAASSSFHRGGAATSSISSLTSMRHAVPAAWSASRARNSGEASPKLKKRSSVFSTKDHRTEHHPDHGTSHQSFVNGSHPILTTKQSKSLFKKLRSVGGKDDGDLIASLENAEPISAWSTSSKSHSSITSSSSSSSTPAASAHQAQVKVNLESQRRKFFLHHDLCSVLAKLKPPLENEGPLDQANIATGASAASAALRNSDPEDKRTSTLTDHGDNINNALVLSCPFFRNEIGGERERKIYLARSSSDASTDSAMSSSMHCPQLARGFSVFNSPTFWKHGYCPYVTRKTNVIEMRDSGAGFFKQYFVGKDHHTYVGVDEQLGPVAISLMRDRIQCNPVLPAPVSEEIGDDRSKSGFAPNNDAYIYRLIARTSSLLTLRGSVPEETIASVKVEKLKHLPAKEVLEFVCPEINLQSLRLASNCEDDLLRLDEAYVQNKYKVGLMYCREGQQSEEEMYNNEHGSAAFNEFLDLIGERVRLKGFDQYKAGLCSKNDSTGQYSVYRKFEDNEIMFHVSTLLPFTANNRQQLPRKRYIGNDIVTIVFQEEGSKPFIPNIKSQFQHVFIIVRVQNPCSSKTSYSVAVSRSKSVPLFGPPIPSGGKFQKNSLFSYFLLTKIINAENAAHRSEKFVSMAVRTRRELLKDLAATYATPTPLDSASKLSNFLSKKKEKPRPRFSPDLSGLCGSLSWNVVVEDCNAQRKGSYAALANHAPVLSSEVEAFLAISSDTILIEQDNAHHEMLFITSVSSIIGWTASQKCIRIYFHQGEALIVHCKYIDLDDMLEIAQTLKAATNGAATQEFSLRRNQMGQLGFHVQHDGLITEVESFGYAWQTGLRQGSRLVEINKFPVSAISHEHMVELLKTSMSVSVTVIPPHPDGQPRKGCNIKLCPYAFGAVAGINTFPEPIEKTTNCSSQQAVVCDEETSSPEWYESASQSQDYTLSRSPTPKESDQLNYHAARMEPGTSMRPRENIALPKTPSSYSHPKGNLSLTMTEDATDPAETTITSKRREAFGNETSMNIRGRKSQSHLTKVADKDNTLQQDLIRLIAPTCQVESKNKSKDNPGNGKSLDWKMLVKEAKEAESEPDDNTPKIDRRHVVTSTDTRTLLDRIIQLERELSTNSKEKSVLEQKCLFLETENHRLQEESETASQQLKKFTEWFFQAIEKKDD